MLSTSSSSSFCLRRQHTLSLYPPIKCEPTRLTNNVFNVIYSPVRCRLKSPTSDDSLLSSLCPCLYLSCMLYCDDMNEMLSRSTVEFSGFATPKLRHKEQKKHILRNYNWGECTLYTRKTIPSHIWLTSIHQWFCVSARSCRRVRTGVSSLSTSTWSTHFWSVNLQCHMLIWLNKLCIWVRNSIILSPFSLILNITHRFVCCYSIAHRYVVPNGYVMGSSINVWTHKSNQSFFSSTIQ